METYKSPYKVIVKAPDKSPYKVLRELVDVEGVGQDVPGDVCMNTMFI